ncbi:MAG: Enoyl-CoA hydratase/isomerase [Phenylobacterium sp.]|nr:Enoyl-CoA hydratase/isomerase [Phenylobacterium sp.]
MREDTPVRLAVDHGLARITLARPQAGNAIDPALCRALRRAAEACAADGSVRAVLLAAEGRAFCVGGDLAAFEAAGPGRPQMLTGLAEDLHAAEQALRGIDAPVVCAVQGAAAGAGFSLAIGADLVLASDSASFTLAYTAIGLSPDGGATYLLPRLVGLRRAQELILTNRRLTAAEALDWGLVTEVVPQAELAARAEALAQRLAAGPTRAFGAAKRLLADSYGRDFRSQVDEEARCIAGLSGEADAAEGIAAFRAKRAPAFTGRAGG